MPKVSIVIPTYNCESTIGLALDSIAKIYDDRIQVVIADGGSSDSTLSICRDAVFPIHIHSSPDRGVYDAMNKSVAFCRGKWILFLGSDDQILPGFLLAINECVDSGTTYYFNAVVTSDNSIYGGSFTKCRLFLNNICHQAILYSRRFLEMNKYDLTYRVLSDYELNLRLFADASCNKIYRPIEIALYNNQTGMSSESIDHIFKRNKATLIRRYYGISQWFCYVALAIAVKMQGANRRSFNRRYKGINS